MRSVVVVGGGILGTAVAAVCARAGGKVTLVERGGLAGGASEIELALIPGEVDTGPYLDLHHFTGGAFFLDRSPPDGWPARRIGARAAAAALAAEARSHGADIRTGCEAKALLIRSGAVRGVLTDTGELAAAAVVLAAGADAWRLLAPHGVLPPGDRESGDVAVLAPGSDPPDAPRLGDGTWVAPDGAGLLHVSRPEKAAELLSGVDERSVLDRRTLQTVVCAGGPAEDLAGLFLAFAPDGWGIARAPAVGTSAAEWLADG